MSVTERQRHELHEWAKRVGDQEVAATLMELLPPVGWADVATKRDLDHLGSQLRAELSEVRSELRVEMRDLTSQQTRTLMIGLVLSITALAITQIVIAAIGR